MKKSLWATLAIMLVLFVLIAIYWVYYRPAEQTRKIERQVLSDEQIELLRTLGNCNLSIRDLHLNQNVTLKFSDKIASNTVNGQLDSYLIDDALPSFNLDQDPEMEYPFIISATYGDGFKVDYLVVAHRDRNNFVSGDQAILGDPDRIEDIHSKGNEVVVEASVPDNLGGKQDAMLTFKFLDGKIIPGKDNIDISKTIEIEKLAASKTNVTPKTNAGGGKVALTFDDGPGVYTASILSVLKQYGVKATFFEIGQNAAAHPDSTKSVAADGHIIGDHTYSHPDLTKLSYDGQYDEINKTKQTLEGILSGTTVKYFRPPYGSYNGITDTVLGNLNLKRVLWNVDTRDWSGKSAADIAASAESGAKSGAIILMHDGVANSKETAKALPGIIERLQSQGFDLVTLDQMYQ